MVESPNLRTIAEQLLERLQVGPEKPFQRNDRLAAIDTELRRLWNARGEADLQLIEEKLLEKLGGRATQTEQWVIFFGEAMRDLDR